MNKCYHPLHFPNQDLPNQANSNVLSHGLNTPLPIPTEPWIDISIDFILGLPRTRRGKDNIFFVVDSFGKIIYFIACHTIDNSTNIVELFFKEIMCLHDLFKNLGFFYENVKFLTHF